MDDGVTRTGGGASPVSEDLSDCPLSRSEQTRNLVIYGINTSLIYLAAPVLYVGTTQATLCDKLGATVFGANLPATAYHASTFLPLLIAWWIPYVRALKWILVICFGLVAATGAAVAVVLPAGVPNAVKVAVVILQGAASGFAISTAVAFQWEVLGRGVHLNRRGAALGLAFGVGPILAVCGSLAFSVLTGKLEIPQLHGLDYPWNYVVLFGAVAPIMGLAAFLSSLFVVPLPAIELRRQPFLTEIVGGFGEFLANRTLRIAAIVTVLAYTENLLSSNLTLYTGHALGLQGDALKNAAEMYAGYMLAIRFGMKAIAGLFLGWLLTKTNPKTGILVTGAIYLSATVWASLVSGPWYLLTFGIYGAGELVGVYAPNYILSASPERSMRRNLAFCTLFMAFSAPAGALFGWVSTVGRTAGSPTDTAAGLRLSFAVCGGLVLAAILIASRGLPARPRP